MFFNVIHYTRYDYSQPVTFAPHALYLRPRESSKQRLHEYSLNVSPEAKRVHTTDAEDNALDYLYFNGQSSTLELTSQCLVETRNSNPFDFILEPYALLFPFAYADSDSFVLRPYLVTPHGTNPSELSTWLEEYMPSPPSDSISFIRTLNAAVCFSLLYVKRDEPGIQTPRETLERGSGSCRDYAVLLIALCRQLGVAARFVSGYVYEPVDPSLINPPVLSMHAWVEVYLPGGGWCGVDPSRGIFCDDNFIAVAHTSRAETVNPIRGNFYSPVPAHAKLSTHLLIENKGR